MKIIFNSKYLSELKAKTHYEISNKPRTQNTKNLRHICSYNDDNIISPNNYLKLSFLKLRARTVNTNEEVTILSS